MINCDQAFEFMTSQDSESQPELSRHLEDCPRCREMAEVLSPVLGELNSVRQFLDSEPAISRRDDSSGVQLAIRAAETLQSQDVAKSPSSRANSVLTSRILLTTLIFLIGLSGGWSLSLLKSDNLSQVPHSSVLKTNDCTWITPAKAESRSPKTVTLTCMACHLSLDSPR